MEYLSERVQARLDLQVIQLFFKQCASAVAFLHGLSPPIIHRKRDTTVSDASSSRPPFSSLQEMSKPRTFS